MSNVPQPEVTRRGLLGMQVCVPESFTDEQAEEFANNDTPTGIESRWTIRREGDPALCGCAERVPCEDRAGCVHIMMDC